MKRILFFLLLISGLAPKASGQEFQYIFGYGFGVYTPGLNSMKFHALQMNEFYNEYWTDKLRVPSMMRGAEIEFRIKGESFSYSAIITHRKSDMSSGGVNPATGFDEKLKMKMRLNHFSFLCAEYIFSDGLSFGASICEIGRFKVFYKHKNDETPDPKKWEEFYDDQKGIFSFNSSYGSTFFFRLERGRFQGKLSYHLDWFGVNPKIGSQSYYYKPNNLFFSLNYNFGNL